MLVISGLVMVETMFTSLFSGEETKKGLSNSKEHGTEPSTLYLEALLRERLTCIHV